MSGIMFDGLSVYIYGAKLARGMGEEKSQPKIAVPGGPKGKSIPSPMGVIAHAVAFFKETLGKEGEVIKAVSTADGGWEVEVEVIEPNEHMKRIGISKPVYDKNIYRLLLDKNFTVTSYERKSLQSSSPQE